MEFVTIVLEYLTQGGAAAVIVILACAVAILIWDRKILIKTLSDTTQKVYDAKDKQSEIIASILDRYHRGNLDLINALNEIKNVLLTIQITKK